MRRGDRGVAEAHREGRPEAGAERDLPLPVELDPDGDAAQAQRLARQVKRRLVDVHVPGDLQGALANVEADLVGPEVDGHVLGAAGLAGLVRGRRLGAAASGGAERGHEHERGEPPARQQSASQGEEGEEAGAAGALDAAGAGAFGDVAASAGVTAGAGGASGR